MHTHARADEMSLQGSWSDDGRLGRHVSASAEYLHRQDTTGSTNSPEAPLTRQRDLWPEPAPGQQPGSMHTTPELMAPHGKRLQQPASVETTASAQTAIPDAAGDCSIGRQVWLGPSSHPQADCLCALSATTSKSLSSFFEKC